jgi:hypothetical protein
MKVSEIEDADQLVTKDWLTAQLAQLELRISDRIAATERANRVWMAGAYALIFGTYALIVAATFINHFWK